MFSSGRLLLFRRLHRLPPRRLPPVHWCRTAFVRSVWPVGGAFRGGSKPHDNRIVNPGTVCMNGINTVVRWWLYGAAAAGVPALLFRFAYSLARFHARDSLCCISPCGLITRHGSLLLVWGLGDSWPSVACTGLVVLLATCLGFRLANGNLCSLFWYATCRLVFNCT